MTMTIWRENLLIVIKTIKQTNAKLDEVLNFFFLNFFMNKIRNVLIIIIMQKSVSVFL